MERSLGSLTFEKLNAMNATLSDPSTWVPFGETPTDLLNDSVYLTSVILCGFGYGIALTLYCICARTLFAQLGHEANKFKAKIILAYITTITLCGGIYFASATRVVQCAYVDFREFPRGPYAYTVFTFSSAENTVAVVTFFIVIWMADAMLIWRLYILYSSKKYVWAVILFPCLLYVGSLCMSFKILHEISRPTQSFWSNSAVPFTLAYLVLTAALTIISNLFMTARLLVARRQYVRAMGNTPHAKQYLSIVAMLVESSALFAVWSIIFIGLYAVNHPLQNLFLKTLVDVAIIALLLIIYRVSQDRAWKADTDTAFTGLEWRNGASIRGSRYIQPSFQGRNGSSTTRLENVVTVETFTVDDNKRMIGLEP